MKYAAHSFGCNRSSSAEPLVISQLGNAFGTSGCLTSCGDQIDKKVFMRMLSYYEISSQTVCPRGAPTKMNVTQPAAAAHRRMP
jgi:hypothetical protein